MNILITAIGSMSANAVLNSLRNFPDAIKIIATDIYPYNWISNASDVDSFYRLPKAIDKNYIPELLNICKSENINYLFPLIDPEVDVLAENIDLFDKINTKVCISDSHIIKICRDKLNIFNFFKDDNKVQLIPTYSFEETFLNAVQFPLIAKPKKGRSSEGIFKLYSKNQLSNINFNTNEYIFQPFLKGEIYTVDYIRDFYSNHTGVCRKELLRTVNGAGITVQIEKYDKLLNTVYHIGSMLGLKGCVNMEFIFTSNKFYLMDINPRFSAGIAFSILSGYDMVANHLKVFMNEKIQTEFEITKQILTKYYIEKVLI